MANSDAAPESVLIEAARFNLESFDVLYQRYVHRIYRYACARLNNTEEAADATQQIFLHAWQSLGQYRGDSPFGAWLFGIAHHVITDLLRRRHMTISWEHIHEEAHPHTADANPETIALFHESQRHLQHLLQQLAPEKQELLALYRDGQLSIAEIALIIGKRPEAVRKQLARTLKALREHYHATNP